MKDDAEILHLIYEKRLVDLESNEQDVVNTLNSRLRELEVQGTTIKTIIFDAKLQYRSNDILEETYQEINTNSTELLDRIQLEKDEINSFLSRITQPYSEIVTNGSEDKNIDQTQAEEHQHVDEVGMETETCDSEGINEQNSTVFGDSKDDEVEGNWLNEVLTKDTA
jgi:hypothetical protein